MFASFEYRNFRYLFLGQVTHSGALWLDMVARPLLVLAVTGSPVHLGLVMAVRTVPAMGFGLIAGVVADSFERRTVLLTTKVVVFGLAMVFAVLVVMDWVRLWHIYLFTFVRGLTMAFDQPARRAMIPSIVPSELVTNAMALSSGSVQIMRIVGAGGAGLIIAFGGLDAVFVTMAVFYATAVAATWALEVPDHNRAGYQGIRSAGADLVDGFRFAWHNAAVRGVLIASAGYFAFGMTFMSVFGPLFATQVLDIGESGFGYMMAATGLGGVVGSLVLAASNPSRKRGILLLATVTALGVLLILFSAASYVGSVVLVFMVAAVLGVTTAAVFPIVNAVLVQSAPEDMRGRVLGLLSLDRGMTTFGGALAGLLAAAVGAQPAQIIFGAGCIATALAMLVLYPVIRRID
jgi:MFS family permease